jgi:protein phosphatase
MFLCWDIAAATHRGHVRKDNQDNYYISPDHSIIVVADGMGGEKGGALASRLAVEAIETFFWENIPDTDNAEAVEDWLLHAVTRANRRVFDTRMNSHDTPRLGTTIVVAAQSEKGSVHVAHLGDSRAYRITPTEIAVLTQDHSVGFELLLRGQMTMAQYESSPFRNYLTRCVGHDEHVIIDRSPSTLVDGDYLLLCTDGLTNVVREDQIAEAVRNSESTYDACEQLVQRTLEGGAPDNVTVICARYVESKAALKGAIQVDDLPTDE